MRTNRAEAGAPNRLAPEAFYNAAFKILGEVGYEDLTVDSLCARLNVTKGSFYHHFANTTEFLAGLLQCWEDSFDQNLQQAESLDQAQVIEAAWLAAVNRPWEAEGALRSWATSNPMVAATVRRVDEKYETVASAALLPLVGDPERCRVLAFMGMCMTAGMQQRPQPLDRELMMAAHLEFIRAILGVEAVVEGERLRVLETPNPTAPAARTAEHP